MTLTISVPAKTTNDRAVTVPRRSWWALIVLFTGMFIALLDTTIVNVALPSIQRGLQASESTLSWIVSGYALAFGLALIPAGRVGDRLGHKWVFFTGVALFTLASAACGLAGSGTQLVIFRVAQGLAAGIFVPSVTAFIALLFARSGRGKAFAIMGAVIGTSSAVGPIAGGLIINVFGDTNGWRLVFAVNLPIGLITLIAAALVLPGKHDTPATSRAGLDWAGLALLAAGLTALLVPLIEGQEQGWPLWTYLTLSAGAALIVVFALWELYFTRRGGNPLVPPRLFRHPAFTGGVILALVYHAAFTSIFFTIAILWQTGLGHSALSSGVAAIPFAIGSVFSALRSNQLAQRLGRNVLVVGAAVMAGGLIWLWLVLRTANPTSLTHWDLVLPLLIAGLGNGAFIAPNVQFIIATVEQSEAGAASGVISTMQRVGSAIGIAIIGSVLFGSLALTGSTTTALDFTHAAANAMAVSAGLSVAALLLVFVLPRRTVGPPRASVTEATPGVPSDRQGADRDGSRLHLALPRRNP